MQIKFSKTVDTKAIIVIDLRWIRVWKTATSSRTRQSQNPLRVSRHDKKKQGITNGAQMERVTPASADLFLPLIIYLN